ncbi:MAG: 30S ribosomal protein S6e [Candidatus Bathyarchaeia archaeon]
MPILVISNPDTGKSQRVELDESRISPLMGLRIGEVVEGSIADMSGYKLELTGGTDKDGIPMRPDVHGSAKVDIILSGGVGYKPRNKGERKRVVVRGNTTSSDTTYLNFKIVERPQEKKAKEKPLEEEMDETLEETPGESIEAEEIENSE